jgi:hypothetical protein
MPLRPRGRCVVRAEAEQQQQQHAAADAAEVSRRQLLGGSVALGAAAGLLPLATPGAAHANKVLSSDWEQVCGLGHGATRVCSERACCVHSGDTYKPPGRQLRVG